jgi:hypothetical protein
VVVQGFPGSPAGTAKAISDTSKARVLRYDDRGVWVLRQSLESAAVVFEESATALIRKKIECFPNKWQEQGIAFLRVAALTGPVVPVDSILGFLGIADGDTRDEFITCVDDCFGAVEEEDLRKSEGDVAEAIFIDAEFKHPGVPKSLVYIFVSDIFRSYVIKHAESHARRLARAFLEYIDKHPPAKTRTVAYMCRHLAQQAGESLRVEEEDKRLCWWVGMLERNELSLQLREALRGIRVQPDHLWQLYNIVNRERLVQQALALLEAFYVPSAEETESLGDPAVVPYSRLGLYYYEHGKQLNSAGETTAAVAEFENALEFCERDSKERANVLFHFITASPSHYRTIGYLDDFLSLPEGAREGFPELIIDGIVRLVAGNHFTPGALDRYPGLRSYFENESLGKLPPEEEAAEGNSRVAGCRSAG